jgi:FkbM family methyltransferase
MFQRILHYSKEAFFAFSKGKTWHDKFSLLINSIRFHLSNKNNIKLKDTPHVYNILLKDNYREVSLRNFAGDIFVFYEIFLEKCYFIPPEWLGKVSTIIDLGANIGMTALYYKNYLYPDAKYICVEASKQNIVVLKKNVSYTPSIIVLEGAIDYQSGWVTFDDQKAAWGGAITNNSQGTKVKSYTIDEICSQNNIEVIDILKVDIEGGEADLLQKANQWLHKVRCIIIEIHYPYLTIEQLKKSLEPYNFVVLSQAPAYGVRMICAFSKDKTNFNVDDPKVRQYIV